MLGKQATNVNTHKEEKASFFQEKALTYSCQGFLL
jgi:hypothetical protein